MDHRQMFGMPNMLYGMPDQMYGMPARSMYGNEMMYASLAAQMQYPSMMMPHDASMMPPQMPMVPFQFPMIPHDVPMMPPQMPMMPPQMPMTPPHMPMMPPQLPMMPPQMPMIAHDVIMPPQMSMMPHHQFSPMPPFPNNFYQEFPSDPSCLVMPHSRPAEPLEQPEIVDIAEQTAQLLFSIVKYIKCECSTFMMHDQKLLLKSSWRELFIIFAVEEDLTDQLTPIIKELEAKWQDVHTPRGSLIRQEANLCERILKRMAGYQLSNTEYHLLRAVALFKPVKQKEGKLYDDNLAVHRRQLAEHKFRLHLPDEQRRANLTASLNNIRHLSVLTIEELFFRNIVQENNLTAAIVDILDPV